MTAYAGYEGRKPPVQYWPPGGHTWTGTGGIDDHHSYSWIIHNAIFDRLSTSTFFQGFAVKRISEALPIEASYQVPFLGVYEGEENMVPHGPGNMGDMGFVHTFTIGIQVAVKENDPIACLATLDRAYWFVMNRLWRDNSFTNMLATTMAANTRFQSVQRIKKRKRWGATGSKNETPVGVLQLDITFQITDDFAPTEFDDLERITVTTAYPEGGTPEEIAAVQQVKMVYEFTPEGAVPTPLPPDP